MKPVNMKRYENPAVQRAIAEASRRRDIRDVQRIHSKPVHHRDRLSREYDRERDYLGDRAGGDPRELRFE